MTPHPNNVVTVMREAGYSLADLLPAYPGRSEAYIDQVLRDCALALSRPVLPYGLLGIHPCRSRYFNVGQHGFRSVGSPQPWPPIGDRTNIFVFGGSTTVGFGVEDGQTVPAELRVFLAGEGLNCEVYNFASGNYTSRHEALRFLDLLDRDLVPDVAVFLDGYNECFYAFGNGALVRLLDSLYQEAKRRRRRSRLGAILDLPRASIARRERDPPRADTYVPEVIDEEAEAYVSEEGVRKALESGDRPLAAEELTDTAGRIATRVWQHYLDSRAMITEIARRRGIQVLFAWQPVPFYATRKEQRVLDRLYYVYPFGAFCWPVYNWLSLRDFESLADDPTFLDLSRVGASIDAVLYVDMCHYTARFSRAIAEALGRQLAMLAGSRA